MKQFHNLYAKILAEGVVIEGDRTGVGTRSIFGHQMRFDLRKGFPLLGTKFTPFKLIATELLWFLQGNPDISYLHEHNNHIWDKWVKDDGTFGPIYGHNWRSWLDVRSGDLKFIQAGSRIDPREIDQVQNVIARLKSDPLSRRHIVSAWNVADVESGEMALPPCHVLFQFYARPLSYEDRYHEAKIVRGRDVMSCHTHEDLDEIGIPRYGLSCQLYQRSADSFLGVPFNIASYSLLTHMIAHLTNMVPEEFIWTGGDTHLYLNHDDQIQRYLKRTENLPLPTLKIKRKVESIDDFALDDFEVVGYRHLGKIAAPVAI